MTRLQVLVTMIVVWGLVALMFALSDVPTVYRDTATKEVAGCSRDGIQMAPDDEICKVIVQERHDVVWSAPGWRIK